MITAPRLFCITAPPPQRRRLLRSTVPKPPRISPPSFRTGNPLKASVFPFFRLSPLVLLLRSSSSLSSSSSSMEAPPPGYRKNVGICLVSGSYKVSFFFFLDFSPFFFFVLSVGKCGLFKYLESGLIWLFVCDQFSFGG